MAEWDDYLRGDAALAGAVSTFPFVRQRGAMTLIGVSSAVPTAPFMATGALGPEQLDALDRTLSQLADDAGFRVLLIHHPLTSASSYKRLTDADALLALIKRHRIDLVLHGHDHVHSTMWFDGFDGRVPAVGVPSASAVAHGHHPAAAYNLFTVTRDGDAWRCEQRVRGFGDGARIEELQRAQII
jgi:3',5'-cyclic AMP phosphodiesterase CpdA